MTRETIPGGLLVAIEGIDGAGKSTLARQLAAALEAAGASVSMSKEPTNGPWGMKLRESAATGRLTAEEEAELLIRDRREHVDSLIAPALARGEVVILDRYYPSMIAYQGAAGISIHDLVEANRFAPRPHLLMILDVDPLVGLGRIRARGDSPNHFETVENLSLCREIFLQMDEPRKLVVDGSQSADDVLLEAHHAVIAAMANRMVESGIDRAEAVEKLVRLNAGVFVPAQAQAER